MTVTIEPLACGTLTASGPMFGADVAELTVPVPSWLIRHPQGAVLFDAGMPEALSAESPLRDLVSLFFEVGLDASELVSSRLEAAEVDGEHDLFGDGRVTCVPTSGHTPGHQSLRVRLVEREVVLCGDCAYFESTLDGGPLPAAAHDHAQQSDSIARLRAMRDAGALVVPGHDPDTFAALPSILA